MSPTLIMTALQAPSIGHRAAARYHEIANAVDRAGLSDQAHPTKLSAAGPSWLAKTVNAAKPGMTVGGLIAGGALAAFGKELGSMGAGLLRDMASKAQAAVGSVGENAARKAIVDQLKKEDPVLAQAQDKTLMEAYHTMVRFAPQLSTDKNAVRSFLRQAVMSGAGPDYMAIKLLADAERSVTSQGKDSK
jgi:hypothetical protein